ncbi:hypothetical protein OsI_04232 [Oryza sativa Indica Group]|uniref:Uncharacterized protein n=1 Tax=Oryza sativa subsp. indica TaxID=39946 RepID=B8ABB8_ORYSI|nr:hypothetical protein OsI_04232 [Oryza sativa Indica Group]
MTLEHHRSSVVGPAEVGLGFHPPSTTYQSTTAPLLHRHQNLYQCVGTLHRRPRRPVSACSHLTGLCLHRHHLSLRSHHAPAVLDVAGQAYTRWTVAGRNSFSEPTPPPPSRAAGRADLTGQPQSPVAAPPHAVARACRHLHCERGLLPLRHRRGFRGLRAIARAFTSLRAVAPSQPATASVAHSVGWMLVVRPDPAVAESDLTSHRATGRHRPSPAEDPATGHLPARSRRGSCGHFHHRHHFQAPVPPLPNVAATPHYHADAADILPARSGQTARIWTVPPSQTPSSPPALAW